ncbi:MAG: hypothetical protein EHM20_01525 [Alphaproteobacteria bacterium]|nr:MAG: hypothetical protein EHM20_01525 [Alphaproteobacteria bacterium]
MRTREEKIFFLQQLAKGKRSVHELLAGNNYTLKQLDGNPDAFILTNYLQVEGEKIFEEYLTIEQLSRYKFYKSDLLIIVQPIKKHDLLNIIQGEVLKVFVLDDETAYGLHHLKKQA